MTGEAPLLIATIGHSNRSLEEFLELLQEHGIEQVLDVRKLPGSNKYPQFNADTLGEALREQGITLLRKEALTGRRPVSKVIPFEVNAWWQVRSFHNYADHALSEEFRQALAELQELASERATALMCSEAVWWRCHRRIITDHLLAHDVKVLHILGHASSKPAELSEGAVVGPDLQLSYPAPVKKP